MAHKNIDRCKETTSTTGTGTLTLTGAVSGFVAVADSTSGLTTNGDTSWFLAENGAEWELFLGTRVDATHLARTDPPIASSNAGAQVNFTAPPIVFSTVPGAKLSAVGPSFSAYLSSAQTFTTAVTTKVAFNSEHFDNGSCFDSTTNRRFQPTVAGNYQVSWLVTFKSTGALSVNTYTPTLYKNGAIYANSNYANCAATVAALGGSALVYMNGTTDYLEVFAVASGTGTLTFGGGTGETTFSAYLAALPGAPMLAPIVAPGPSFCAYRSTDQTGVPDSTYVKVAFNAEEFDNGNCFDSTTNGRFQPNVEGYYQVSWVVACDGTTLTVGHAQLHKNGTVVATGNWNTASSSVGLSSGSTVIYMNGTTDYLEVYGYSAAASGNKFRLGAAYTRFSGFLAALPQVPQPTSGPAFRAYLSANQTGMTSGAWAKAALNTTEFDVGGCFDAVTNNRFTPNVAGYYKFDWLLHGQGATLTTASAKLYKNGANVTDSTYAANSSTNQRVVGSRLIYMNGTTDYVELWGLVSGTTLAFVSGSTETSLSGHWVRPG